VTPKTKRRLSIIAIIVGGYLLLNAIMLAALGPIGREPPDPVEKVVSQIFGLALGFAIGGTLVYYGNKYRKLANKELKSPDTP
jgi:hypothetical protein